MYALKTWESPVNTMLEKYKEYLTDDGVFIMTAAEQLKQQGLQQGVLEGKKETAINFLSMGLAVDEVAKGTGLEKSAIEALKALASKNRQH